MGARVNALRSNAGYIKHGHACRGHISAEYGVWEKMKARCSNPLVHNYENYGGRGITVCDEWAASFAAFYADMGPRPSADHSIDRIDNDKGYCPSNCRWATRKEQSANRRQRRDTVFVELPDGRRLTVPQVIQLTGLRENVVRARVRRGLSFEDVL
jgi:hypothetical protein